MMMMMMMMMMMEFHAEISLETASQFVAPLQICECESTPSNMGLLEVPPLISVSRPNDNDRQVSVNIEASLEVYDIVVIMTAEAVRARILYRADNFSP